VVRIYDVNDLLVKQDCFSSIIRVCVWTLEPRIPRVSSRSAIESVSLLSAISLLKTTIARCRSESSLTIGRVDRTFCSTLREVARTCASRARQKHTNKIVTRINTSSKNIDIDSDKDKPRISLRYYFSTIAVVEHGQAR
jgi:hypothetical protein